MQVMKDLWTNGVLDFKGNHFTMNDCRLLPKSSHEIKLIRCGTERAGYMRMAMSGVIWIEVQIKN